ncbi:osteopontin isoform X3 [Conger conger]|uniref:osteopontin isoform X3 n=1 Tax=Conger conger TaxID=82655 RepID=UPI002A59FD75|nr:osteopontin isoform X3 [Conger conger]
MKTVIVFLVLLATVFCHPVKRSVSSSESSEEVVRLKADPMLQNAAPPQTMTVGSDESPDSSDEAQSDSASDDSADTDENDTESDESEESTESPTQSPSEPPTEPPVIWETTPEPVTDSGRGDNLGYPSNYKKDIIYVESNSINKGYSPYKYYDMEKAVESMGLVSKKAPVYDAKGGNDIEKNLKVYKQALQVHEEEEEDASTPEVESQGLDSAGGMAKEPAFRQADLEPEAAAGEPAGAEESASAGESDSSSSSTSEEEGDESQSSQSSEETTATPADSSQSSESQEGTYTDAPVIIIAK